MHTPVKNATIVINRCRDPLKPYSMSTLPFINSRKRKNLSKILKINQPSQTTYIDSFRHQQVLSEYRKYQWVHFKQNDAVITTMKKIAKRCKNVLFCRTLIKLRAISGGIKSSPRGNVSELNFKTLLHNVFLIQFNVKNILILIIIINFHIIITVDRRVATLHLLVHGFQLTDCTLGHAFFYLLCTHHSSISTTKVISRLQWICSRTYYLGQSIGFFNVVNVHLFLYLKHILW